MSIPKFLNKKFLDWQVQEGERKTVEEFGKLFGASKSLMSNWMNGARAPGPEYKKRIVELFGAEAVRAFGEDPDLYYLQDKWDDFTPEARRAIRELAEKYSSKNETERVSKM